MAQWMQFWWGWLVVVVCSVIIFNVGLVIAPNLMQQFFNVMFFSSSKAYTDFGNAATLYVEFVYGVLGAVMIGWMTTLLYILVGSFRSRQREAWWAIAAPIVVWFAVDSWLSISTGFWQNAVFNTLFLVLFIIPLAATYRYFNASSHSAADEAT